MLAISQITSSNGEVSVYTVPTGKNAYIYIDINPITTSPTCTVKINNYVYYTGTLTEMLTMKLSLTENDIIKVSTSGTVNVFVHGIVS